jgi:hypothetical protein
MGLHTLSLLGDVAFWYFHYKTRTTNPGILDETNPETAIYRKLYEQTIESFSTFSYEDDDNDDGNKNDAEINANKMKNMSVSWCKGFTMELCVCMNGMGDGVIGCACRCIVIVGIALDFAWFVF